MRRSYAIGLIAVLASCSTVAAPDFGGMPIHFVMVYGTLDLSASTQVRDDSVVVTLVVTNRGTTAGRVEHGECSFAVRGAGARGQWDNRLPPNGACPDPLYTITVPQGETRERTILRRSVDDLRNARSADVYDVTVYYRAGNDSDLTELRAGRVTF